MKFGLIFDVDGTLADTEEMHRLAFNKAFEDEGLNWRWDKTLYGKLLSVTGGKERIRTYWNEVDPVASKGPEADQLIADLHRKKTGHYVEGFQQGTVKLRPGIKRLIGEARSRGIPLAIATTTRSENVEILLRSSFGEEWNQIFDVIEDAGTAPNKKPDPEAYLNVLKRLAPKGLSAENCLALEDSRNGLIACMAAKIKCLVTPCEWTQSHDFSGAAAVIPNLGDLDQPLSDVPSFCSNPWVDLDSLVRLLKNNIHP